MLAAYLAYRRDGGENQSNPATANLTNAVFDATSAGQAASAAAQIDELTRRPNLPADLVPVLPALQAILTGSRDPALAAELLLLLELEDPRGVGDQPAKAGGRRGVG